MACDTIQPRIRPFLDDLLDEKDYQDIHAHLEVCESCRKYASSVGTLSYRLYELGQVPLPLDMVSTVLYESKKAVPEPPAPAAAPTVPAGEGVFISKKDLFWAGVALLLVLTVTSFVVTMAFRKKEERSASAPTMPVSLPPAPDAAPQADAEPVPAHTE